MWMRQSGVCAGDGGGHVGDEVKCMRDLIYLKPYTILHYTIKTLYCTTLFCVCGGGGAGLPASFIAITLHTAHPHPL